MLIAGAQKSILRNIEIVFSKTFLQSELKKTHDLLCSGNNDFRSSRYGESLFCLVPMFVLLKK